MWALCEHGIGKWSGAAWNLPAGQVPTWDSPLSCSHRTSFTAVSINNSANGEALVRPTISSPKAASWCRRGSTPFCQNVPPAHKMAAAFIVEESFSQTFATWSCVPPSSWRFPERCALWGSGVLMSGWGEDCVGRCLRVCVRNWWGMVSMFVRVEWDESEQGSYISGWLSETVWSSLSIEAENMAAILRVIMSDNREHALCVIMVSQDLFLKQFLSY